MSHPSRQAKSLSQKSMAETDEDQQTQRKIIELNESEEGQITSSSNYIFQQIGFPLRLNPNPSNFDLDNPPTHALAISHNPQSLLFLAHSKGFYVAKTAEVVARAKLAKEEDNKGYCIQELCVVDVQIGEIRSLAVSKDSSTLAVCVGAKVEFYSVESLLNKEREPFYSCGIEDSIYVKDFRWRKKLENSFLVLGSDGRLYYGDLDSPLKVVMGNVDAVDWSTEGNFIIVAEQDSLSIFSSSFKEQYTLSMPFNSTDTDSEGTIKVDSINWIRKDCVILGCFQITGDGEENGYLIQVVSCKEGDISEGSSELVLISFNEAFVGIDDDTIPFGCGPHLFLSYLEHGKIALVANKKSTEEHIQLFSWSLDAKQTEVVQVYQSQDEAYLPRIHYQENEDDNMIMGFGVDATSLCEKVHVTLGVERKELSPYCILLCLTLDEKILMFYVADATESADSRKIGTPFSDETEKPSAAITLACDNSGTSSQFEEHNAKEKGSYAQQLKMSQDEVETNEGGLVLKGHALQTPDLNDNLKNASPSPQPLASKRESSILACDNSGTSSQFEEHNAKEKGSYAQQLKMSQDEVETNEGGLVLKGHALQTPDLNDNLKNASPSPQPLASKTESSILDKSTVAVGSNSLCKDSILLQKPVVPSSGVLGTSTGSMSSIFQSKNKDSLGSDLVSNSFSRNSQALDFGSNSLSKDTINLQKPSGVLGTSTGSTPSIFQSKNKDSLGSDEASNAFSRNSQAPAFGFNSLSKDPINLQKPSADLGTSTGSAPSNFHSKIKDPLVSDEASNLFSRNLQRDGVQSASSGSHSSHKLLSSNESNSRLTSTTDNRVEQSGSRVQNTALDTGNQSLSDLRFSSILNTREPNSVPQFSTNVSGKSAPIGGQHSSARVAKFGSESGMRISQVSPYGGSSSQNPLESRLQPPDEKVNEMAKELDVLLSGIEREGGFRDACIIFQEDSVLGIEQDLDYLAKRCRVLKSMMEERFDGVQNLLDQTVQVLARKIYIEGIVKQASDSQYWDLWDRQKLTPELELKRKQILKFNQNLTNQLIELERHFNTLELNKFGENCEVHTTRRVLQSSSKSSRDGQAFHKLYNTMNSQLAAAEQLSQCLTKQMAVLNIEPASAKRKSVTKELFESIGLSYDGDSFRSPNVKKAIQSPESIKKLPFSSARGAIKDQSRRSPSSVVKSFESETARRRVSLDRSWATFTPPKTTVKRMLLQEEQPQMNANKSSLVANKEGGKQFSPVAHLRDHKNYSVPSHLYVRKEGATTSQLHAERDNEDKATKQVPFKWTKDLSGNFQSATMKPPVLQANQRSNLVSSSSGVDTMSSPRGTQKITNEISERPAIGQTLVNKFDQSSVQPISYSNATPIFPSESSVNRTSVTTNLTPAQTLSSSNRTSQMPASMLSLNHKDTQAKSTSHAMNHREICREIAINASVKSQGSESAPCGLPATSSLKEFPQHQTVKREIQLGSSPVHPISVSPSSPSPPETTKAPVLEMPTPLSIPPSSSSSTSLVTSEEYIKTSTNVEVPSTSSYSSSSHSTSPFSFSFQTGNQQFNPSLSSTTINTSSQVPSTDIKTTTPPMEPKPSSSEPSLKSDVNAARTSPLQSEPPTAAPTSTAFSSTTIVTDTKNETSDVAATQEDEMEEEASDTTTDLNLGSLGGFNLGSAPPSAAPKSNPFGGAFHNTAVNSASSSFNFSVPSGELFRPASFSIQPIQPSQPASQSAFSRPFTAPEPTQSGFGQPAQIGSGQAALGAVLGGFGQSRQLGTTPPGTGFTSTTGFGGGFATPVPGGFANATSGGFAGVSGTGGGFSGGFTAAAPAGGGFAAAGSGGGGGFAGAGSGGSGGFGSFGNQQGGTGFSSFGGGSAGSGNLNPLFTQMRK